MTVDDFVDVTQRVIARDGFEDYIPALVLPQRSHVIVLEGIPSGVNVDTAARAWAARESEDREDFFLSFKADRHHFKVVARLAGLYRECVVTVSSRE